jgi:hypothetical protein
MLRKALAALGLLASTSEGAAPPYTPYASQAANDIYNLLFCDDVAAFAPLPGQKPTPWQAVLLAKASDVPALRALAADPSEEGRVRYLAFARLRSAGQPVEPKQLLGVIVEVPLAGGLDTLAAYSEGGVRYVNQSGKLLFIEGVASFRPLVDNLFAAAQPIVAAIGPWDKPRRAPLARGQIRMTFLVSDGFYFGEGPLEAMQREPTAAALIGRATELLQTVVAAPTK